MPSAGATDVTSAATKEVVEMTAEEKADAVKKAAEEAAAKK
jgi:hypothetical protein